tara:strand:+ start:120 stop:461 length:342 start_codon:yes stop_codon:yes gene_type:complete
MGFFEHIFGYSNIDSALERAAGLKNKTQVSVKDVKELIEVIDNYIRSRSEWARGMGVPGGHSKRSIYSDYSIRNAYDNLDLAITTSEAIGDNYLGDIAKLFLDKISLTKHNMF